MDNETWEKSPLPRDEGCLRQEIKAAFQRALNEAGRLEALLLALALRDRARQNETAGEITSSEGTWIEVKRAPSSPAVASPAGDVAPSRPAAESHPAASQPPLPQ